MTAVQAQEEIARGALKAIDYAEACIARVGERDGEIKAWAHFDADHVRRQARAADAYRATGAAIGSLHGLPVGVKDIIDTAGMPTENGTVLDAGRVPGKDAAIVSRLKAAGAIVMGKTVTTELAGTAPAGTRNPHNPAHTPGGSSSGSAAAVADAMMPLAVGTQSNGSVIRPAAFCGVVGFKPTFGAVPRTGVLMQSPFLDTVGAFARTVEDAALLADALFGYDAGDPATAPRPAPRLLETAKSPAPVAPAFAFVRQPAWERADVDTAGAFAELVELLGEQCEEVELPRSFAEAGRIRRLIHLAELAKCYHRYGAAGRDRLSPQMRETLAEGEATLARDYISALDWREVLNAGLDEIFARFNVILTPAAPGVAPAGHESTGDASFCALWTLCGTPAGSLPLLTAGNGMPMGVQLVGPRGDDARLLRTARWLTEHLAEAAG
jgi:aspartyl-tRNA(Asn)/glutamyl-tRNA(Gln) amidotransferase subunit A